MNRVLRDIRLIPIVLFATISLLALKVSGLVFDGGYTLAERLQGRIQDRHAGHDRRRACRTIRKIVVADKQGQTRRSGTEAVLGAGDVQLQYGPAATSPVQPVAEEKPSDPALKISDKPPESAEARSRRRLHSA